MYLDISIAGTIRTADRTNSLVTLEIDAPGVSGKRPQIGIHFGEDHQDLAAAITEAINAAIAKHNEGKTT